MLLGAISIVPRLIIDKALVISSSPTNGQGMTPRRHIYYRVDIFGATPPDTLTTKSCTLFHHRVAFGLGRSSTSTYSSALLPMSREPSSESSLTAVLLLGCGVNLSTLYSTDCQQRLSSIYPHLETSEPLFNISSHGESFVKRVLPSLQNRH